MKYSDIDEAPAETVQIGYWRHRRYNGADKKTLALSVKMIKIFDARGD